MSQLVAILNGSGLHTIVGKHSIRIEECSDFVFEGFGGDSKPCIDASAESICELHRQVRHVSEALSMAKLSHRFELYDYQDELIHYFHHEWPLDW